MQASAVEKRRIVSHCHAHRRPTVARIRGTLEEEPGRSDVARREEGIAARHESRDLGRGEPLPVRPWSWRRFGNRLIGRSSIRRRNADGLDRRRAACPPQAQALLPHRPALGPLVARQDIVAHQTDKVTEAPAVRTHPPPPAKRPRGK